jgi:hypothetical protein
MSMPTPAKTWTISSNNRITFVSTIDTMGKYVFGLKAFLKTNSYTIKGSCDGTTGAMDGVDRIASGANWATRATIAGAAQSWVVLTDGNGANILVTYQGSADTTVRLSYSPGGLFVAAGTPSNQPTATDEVVISSGNALTAGSLDHIWNGWVDSTHKMCRFCIFRNNICIGLLWGVELIDSRTVSPPTTFTPAIWGFAVQAGTASIANGSVVGVARPLVGGITVTNCAVVFSSEWYGASPSLFGGSQPDLQGGVGFPIIPLGIAIAQSGPPPIYGKLGALFDHWIGKTSGGADGDTYDATSKTFIGLAGYVGVNTGAGVWPWDTSTPVII